MLHRKGRKLIHRILKSLCLRRLLHHNWVPLKAQTNRLSLHLTKQNAADLGDSENFKKVTCMLMMLNASKHALSAKALSVHRMRKGRESTKHTL